MRSLAPKHLPILQEQRMHAATRQVLDAWGMHLSTCDCDCAHCKCDLYMSAVVSPHAPGMCACLEHWQSVGVPAEQCVILYRWAGWMALHVLCLGASASL
eukprot:243328-Pelagomonas_calceolata.AAC.2